jgi:arsenite methyltransferase
VPDDAGAPFGAGLYEPGQTSDLPQEAVLASLGCGNPLAVAELPGG